MGKVTVIVAEDKQEIRRSLVEILEPEYHVLAAVENGEELVRAAGFFRPDLAVIDVIMPVLNGLEALRRMKAEGIEVKAVMISANSHPAYVRQSLQAGAWGYVLKAAGMEDLPRALEAVAGGKTFISPGIKLLPEQWE